MSALRAPGGDAARRAEVRKLPASRDKLAELCESGSEWEVLGSRLSKELSLAEYQVRETRSPGSRCAPLR